MPKSKVSGETTPKSDSVIEATLVQAQELLEVINGNLEVVGSDIALGELKTCSTKLDEVVLSLQRALLADR